MRKKFLSNYWLERVLTQIINKRTILQNLAWLKSLSLAIFPDFLLWRSTKNHRLSAGRFLSATVMTTLSLPSKNSASGKPVVTCLANIGLIYKHSNTESNESATLVHTSPLVCCTKLLVHYLDKRNCRERDRDRNNVDRLRGDNCRRHRNGTDCDTLRDDVSLYVLLALSGCCRLLRAIVRENSSSLDNDLRRYSLAGHWYSIRPLSRGVNTKSCGTLREDDLSRQYMHVLDDMTAFHWLANNPPIHFSWRVIFFSRSTGLL